MTRSPDERRSITIRSDVDALAEVRSFVRDAVEDFGGSKRVADDLVQAVDEATCNVMIHGYAGKPGEIQIEAALCDRQIQFRILDRARLFDPTTGRRPGTAAPAAPTGPGHMGVGVELMRTMTDAVHHAARPDGGNELTLVRALDAPEED